MRTRIKFLLVLVILTSLLAFFAGCKNKAPKTNYSHIKFNIDPLVQTRWDTEASPAQYQSFTILRNSQCLEPLLEKQLLFITRNILEAEGYEYVADGKDADFIIFLNFTNEYKSSYVPPSQVTVPKYVPQRTLYGNGTWSGNIGGSLTWGSSQSSVTVPSHWTTQTYSRSGYTVGAWYPCVQLSFLDPKRYNEERLLDMLIWTGQAVGCSEVPDLSLTGEMLVLLLLKNFHPAPNQTPPTAWLGISGTVLTPDGKNIYPTILSIAKGTPAETAGLHEWDVILEIDGKQTANMSFIEAKNLLSGNIGDTKRLVIRRMDKTIEADLKLVPFK